MMRYVLPVRRFVLLFSCLLVGISSGCGSRKEDPAVAANPDTQINNPVEDGRSAGSGESDKRESGNRESDKREAGNREADNRTADQPSFSARFLCWNIESEGSDPDVIAAQLKDLGSYDIYALTEFLPKARQLFAETLGKNFSIVVSKSGYNDRLAIAFDTRKFELVEDFEIKEINFENRYRSPLVVLLKDKATGIEFNVMNNHLARGRGEVREKQAEQLVEWARTQLKPTVALGDYNLDYVFETEKGNSAFAKMIKDGVWKWIKPEEMIDTNWYDNPRDPDGKDDYPGSLLDFAFVTGPAKAWKTNCKVIVRPGDFPDDETTSDHRPFEFTVSK